MYSLNFEFRDSLCNFYVNAKYNLHKCEEQLSQFLFTSAVILLGTSVVSIDFSCAFVACL